MKYTLMGNTGVEVSELCFGTMSFGGDADEATSEAMYKRCREVGINFFDTANAYSGGRSEEILGKLIAPERDEIVLTSKFYFNHGDDVRVQRRGTRIHMMRAVEESLRRLGTDRIDVYFIHKFDTATPLEQTLRAFDDLVSQGKILYPAVSNFAAWQIAKALGISAKEGWARFEVVQPMYNLVKRQAEVEILPLAESENLAVIPYSPLGGGLLTGKYGKDRRPETGRIVQNNMYNSRYSDDWMFEVAGDFTELAKEAGYSPVSLAVAWAGAHPAVTAPIIGARNLEQLEPSLQSVEIDMTPEFYERITALSPSPAVATDRTEERSGVGWR